MSAMPSTGRSGVKQPRIASPRSSDWEYRGSRRLGIDHSPSDLEEFELTLGISAKAPIRSARGASTLVHLKLKQSSYLGMPTFSIESTISNCDCLAAVVDRARGR